MKGTGKRAKAGSGGAESKPQPASCCRVEAMVSIDARGQIVLPKDVREKAGIGAGDKLAVIIFQSGGEVCCVSLVRAETLAATVKETLGPVMTGILED